LRQENAANIDKVVDLFKKEKIGIRGVRIYMALVAMEGMIELGQP